MQPQPPAGEAEHEPVELRVLARPVAVGPPLGEEVGDRILALRHRADVLGEAGEPVDDERLEEAGHAAEERVDRLGRRAHLCGEAAGLERLGARVLEHPPRGVEHAGALVDLRRSGYNGVISVSYDTHDVVVVGGRCAGSPLAMLLARAGLKVCLVDRASFPSDTPSTHAIQPSGVRILERLGLREPLERVAAQIEGGRVRFDDVQLELGSVREILGAPMLNARRVTLDAILLDEAASAGVDVRPGTAVTGLLEDGGRVAGVRTAGGDVRARLVVGADGARSTVARLRRAPGGPPTPPGPGFPLGPFEGGGG